MNRQLMKKMLFSLGTVATIAAPVAAVVACTDGEKYVAPVGQVNDLTGAPKDVWHSFFHAGGKTLPKDGTILGINVNGKKIQYTWTAEDSKAATPAAFVGGTAQQPAVLAYLAARFATVKTVSVTAAEVYAAFGVPAHGASTFTPADMTGQPSTVATEQVNGASQAQIDAVKAEITKAKDAGVTAINAAATTQAVDTAASTAKANITKAVVAPVLATDVKTELDHAEDAIETAATARKAALGVVPVGHTYNIGATVAEGHGFHAMFQNALTIKPGDKIQMAFDADTLTYTWLQADADHASSSSWKYGYSGSQQAIVEYVASKLANASHTVDAILAKLGFTTTASSTHGIKLPQTVVTPPATTTKTYSIDNTNVAWHDMFHRGGGGAHKFEGKAGEILEITISGNKITHVLTAQDVTDISALFTGMGMTDQSDAVNFIMNLFIKENASKEAEIRTLFTSIATAATGSNMHAVTIAAAVVPGTTYVLDTSDTTWHALFHVSGAHAFIGKENDILEITLPSGKLSHTLSATDVTTITTAFGTTSSTGQEQEKAVNAIVTMFVAQDSSKTAEIKTFFGDIATAINAGHMHSVTIA